MHLCEEAAFVGQQGLGRSRNQGIFRHLRVAELEGRAKVIGRSVAGNKS